MPTLEQLVALAAEHGVLTRVVADLPEPVARALSALPTSREDLTLGDVAQLIEPGFRRRDHLDYLEARLTQAVLDVERGIDRKIVVAMPARYGKSTLCTEGLCLWVLHRHPDWPTAVISAELTLPQKWSRAIRHVIADGKVPGLTLAPDSQAVGEWETTERGGLVARGVGGSLIGRGAKVMVIDDPFKNFAQAHSAEYRESLREWWRTVASQRLEPPSLTVLVMTRWHEDDLAATFTDQGFEVIALPAIAEEDDLLGRAPGEPLISPLIDETVEQALVRLNAQRTVVGSYAWASQFQQQPAPPKGQIFDVAWWRWWTRDGRDSTRLLDPADRSGRWLTSWDFAFKGTDDSDFVVGQVWRVIGPDRFLIDQVRDRWAFTDTLVQVKALAARYPWITEHLVEDKANGPAVIDVLKREIPGIIAVNPGQDSKESRARAVAPVAESGNVYLPGVEDAPWVEGYVNEFRFFPHGRNDDQVDATTQALNRLRMTEGGLRLHLPSGMGGGQVRSIRTQRAGPRSRFGT